MDSVEDDDNDTEDMQEYETQFFGFTPSSFVDSMFNTTFDVCWKHIQNLLETIQQRFPDEISPDELNKSADVLQTTLAKTMDKGFDKLQVYLQTHLLCIPTDVTLPEDQVHTNGDYSKADEERLDADIEQIQKKILAAKYVNACLRRELEEASSVQKRYDQFLKEIAKMESLFREMGVEDLHEGLIFLSEKFCKLLPMLEDEAFQIHANQDTEDKIETAKKMMTGKKLSIQITDI